MNTTTIHENTSSSQGKPIQKPKLKYLESLLDTQKSLDAPPRPTARTDTTQNQAPAPPPKASSVSSVSTLEKHPKKFASVSDVQDSPDHQSQPKPNVVELPARYAKNLSWWKIEGLNVQHPLEVGIPQRHPDKPVVGLTVIGAVTRLETWHGPLTAILAVAGKDWPRWEKVGPEHDLELVCPHHRPTRDKSGAFASP